MAWLFLFGAIAGNVLGNTFVRTASAQAAASPIAMYLSVPFVLGLAFFGANVVSYTKALQSIPLSIAYPVLVGASITGVALIAAFVFKETLTLPRLLGMALIVAGAALVSFSSAARA